MLIKQLWIKLIPPIQIQHIIILIVHSIHKLPIIMLIIINQITPTRLILPIPLIQIQHIIILIVHNIHRLLITIPIVIHQMTVTQQTLLMLLIQIQHIITHILTLHQQVLIVLMLIHHLLIIHTTISPIIILILNHSQHPHSMSTVIKAIQQMILIILIQPIVLTITKVIWIPQDLELNNLRFILNWGNNRIWIRNIIIHRMSLTIIQQVKDMTLLYYSMKPTQ